MASTALDMIAMTESIGATAPLSDEEGVLRHSPDSAPVYNKALRERKSGIVVDEAFIAKHKEKALAGKNLIDLADKVGMQGLGDAERFNPDLDSALFARGKASKVLNEAIQLLSAGDLDYWCPDEATRQAAPKIRDILVKFSSRLQ